MNVHQVLGLQIANHEKLQLLNWQLKLLEFNPSDYSESFDISKINDAKDDLVRWCDALIDTKILPDSIWNDTNPLEADFEILAETASSGQRLVDEFEGRTSAVPKEQKNTLFAVLNCSVENIDKSLQLIRSNEVCKEMLRLKNTSGFKSFDTFHQTLTEIYDGRSTAERFAAKYSISVDSLQLIEEIKSSVLKYTDLLKLSASTGFSETNPRKLLPFINQGVSELSILKDFHADKEQEGISIGLDEIKSLEPL